MASWRHCWSLLMFPVWAVAQTADPAPEWLDPVEVLSPRVANQEPTGTVAMPVSLLRFEPRIDVQARNFAEGQADVAIRGGTFANTAFQLSALPLYDPQTGHYSAELPIDPEMLSAPVVATGASHARQAWNATAGSVAYRWRPIEADGHAAFSAGEHDTLRGELFSGYRLGGGWGAEVSVAHSRSDGPIMYGDHEFTRYNARVQHATDTTQTDVLVGYQSKFFGWPNLYTPFNSPETENLQTVLVAATHRVTWPSAAGESFVEFGAYHRRNKDDYAFNRFAPVGPVHPFQHTTWVDGFGLAGRWNGTEAWSVDVRGSLLFDRLESTSLQFGRFDSRTYASFGVFPERRFERAPGQTIVARAGATVDTTNRDETAVSPTLELAWENRSVPWHRWSVAYAQTSQVPDYTALNASPSSGLFRGNRSLGRMYGHTVELTGEFDVAGWSGTAGVFVRRDDDLVDWTFRQGVSARAAAALDINTAGVELYARRAWGRFELMLGYTWLEKDADYGGAVVDGSFYALNFPRHRFTAGVVARLGAGLEVRWDNEARLQQENPLRRSSDGALISALGVYWQVPGWRQLQLSLQVDNLWNEDFEEVPAVPAAPRLTTFGARWRW